MSYFEKNGQTITGFVLGASMAAIVLAASAAPLTPQASTATAQIINLKGQPIGSATLTEVPQGVKIRVDASGLPAGQQLAFHIHEKGVCDAGDGFKTAGGHFNPTGKEHGMNSPHGAHAGDMMNVTVAKDGTLHTEVINTAVTLNIGANSIMDVDGSALVLHAKADDYTSQPAGNAGDRIACGVIKQGS